jgi:hypothetical protein
MTATPRPEEVADELPDQLEHRAAEPLRGGAVGDPERTADRLLERVLLDEREAERVRERTRERRLPRARRARDDHEEGRRCAGYAGSISLPPMIEAGFSV